MGVYIPNLEMPRNCWNCRLSQFSEGCPCFYGDVPRHKYKDKRYKDCPLCEVKDNGYKPIENQEHEKKLYI